MIEVLKVLSLSGFLFGNGICLYGLFTTKNLDWNRWYVVFGCTGVWGIASALFWSV